MGKKRFLLKPPIANVYFKVKLLSNTSDFK